MMISYAQNFEDVILWRAFKDIGPGRYVDVGAFHPEIDSVTKWFYDQGWSGINLEPVPQMFEILQAARPRDTNLQAAAGAFSAEAEMAVVPDSMGLSSLDVSAVEANVAFPHTLVKVPVRPLREVLGPFAGQDIHFLKIDAEGSEEAVLRGMDFTRFRPWVVVVEATAPMSEIRTSDKWQGLLTESSYRQVYFDGLNDFYLAQEHHELANRLARPPNVFDQFELAATVRERHAREELQRSCYDLTAMGESLRSEISRRDGELATVREELAVRQAEVAELGRNLAAARAEIDGLREQLAAAQQDNSDVRAQLAAVQEIHAALHQHCQALQQQNANLYLDLDSSETSIVRLSADLSELATALRRDRETHEACQRQLQQVLNSRSFRWLEPARRLRAVLLPHRH
jgi:FkbM family methyltransferase